MNPRRLPWLLPALVGAVLLTLLIGAFAARLVHPYDLEWMEGGMLAHGWRLQRGLPLYPEPGPDWVPYIYPPGYAALLAVFGTDYTVGRALSLGGTALATLSAAWLVGRHGRGPHRWHAGVLAGVVLVGTWEAGGTFLDLVRPDALSLGLLMAAIALGLERRPSAQIVGGLLLAGAFLVKHHAAAWGLPVVVGLWVRDGDVKGALRFGLAALVPAVAALGIAQVTTGGHLLTYLVEVPRSHGVHWNRALPGIPWELGNALPVAVLVTGVWAAWRAIEALPRRLRTPVAVAVAVAVLFLALAYTLVGPELPPRGPDRTLRHLARALGLGMPNPNGSNVSGPVMASIGIAGTSLALLALPVAALARVLGQRVEAGWVAASGIGLVTLAVVGWMRGHVGGFVNVDIPLFAMTAVGLGLAAADLSSRPWLRGWLGPALASALVAAQLAGQIWTTDVSRRIPRADDAPTGDAIVARLAEVEGPIWSPVAPWLSVQAGHEPGPHLIAIWDVANHPDGPWPDTRARFKQAVREGRWRAVVESWKGVGFDVQEYTVEQQRLPGPGRTFRPKTGWRDRPATIRVWITGSATGGGANGRDGARIE